MIVNFFINFKVNIYIMEIIADKTDQNIIEIKNCTEKATIVNIIL